MGARYVTKAESGYRRRDLWGVKSGAEKVSRPPSGTATWNYELSLGYDSCRGGHSQSGQRGPPECANGRRGEGGGGQGSRSYLLIFLELNGWLRGGNLGPFRCAVLGGASLPSSFSCA